MVRRPDNMGAVTPDARPRQGKTADLLFEADDLT